MIESSGTGAIAFTNTGAAAYAGNGNRTLALGGVNAGDNIMGGSIIDGPGGVTTLAKNDAGTWVLTGTNTYTGNTVVNGGRLQLGNGGASGSIASPEVILAAGSLAINRTDETTLPSVISGAGSVIQAGTGTTVVTGANTYTGGTSITAGTLQLGDGGASGVILGAVANDGTLAVQRSDVFTFGNLISGSGGFVQRGAGTTVLTAANAYLGTTEVTAGTLLVEGDQSAASGAARVGTGARLGGSGILGGNVEVADGGILAPGGAGAAGTLTINGGLTLGGTASLEYQFGQANVVGGPLNDLLVVRGDLTLDGTLDVAATPGGSFGPGLYRIISYDGALNDQGLALGTTPGGTYQVQTSLANQVNLLNSSGLSLNFWDGPTGPANGVIDGGSGVWQGTAGNQNWTEQTAQFNASYSDGQFAIFTGAAGTVTVDGSLGAVTTTGMQFAVDGYTVDGDTLALGSAPAIIRVGDGTNAGTAMTATISASLQGAGVVKQDLGTLVLAGNNTYTGGTTISAGTLRIADDANLGDASGVLAIDGAVLHTTASVSSARAVTVGASGATVRDDAGLTLSGVVSGPGALTKTGLGELALTGSNAYAGGTRVNAGSVSIIGDQNLGAASGGLSLDGGTLQVLGATASSRGVTLGAGGGTLRTVADLTLQGAVTGVGALSKTGSGLLVLTGNTDYSGGTTISEGTLQLGDGGSSGAVLGPIRNDGTLVFGRGDTYVFQGLVSGAGVLEQRGTGATVLSSSNTYTGSTAVRAGALYINGDQSAATGATQVDNGALLGGAGTIGGDVDIADGGLLAPGGDGGVPGTLRIKGNLALSGASGLRYDFGQANVVGGPLNDLVQVDGDLVLDGTLDVAVSPGGAFDPGLYRIISYAGRLTDNVLDVGALPSPDYRLQLSVAQQVNLINTSGLTVNFWDGGGPFDDGVVQGGNGTWQASAGTVNWTDVDGALNAGYQDGAFSLFTGAAGRVTVDASLGAINSTGLQFATDGYRVEGDAVTLTGATPIIRVGDGTTLGAGMTATLGSVLLGSSGMTKADLGTLVLTADNTYTGGTRISGGVLQLGEGGASGSVLGDVRNDGTLVFNRNDAYAFGGLISGIGGVRQSGTGSTTLAGLNSYTGLTEVLGGTLRVNGDQSAATGTTTVASGATLGGNGVIGGDVIVADGATLRPGASPGTLTINGSLLLNGASLLDYEFGQAASAGGVLNDLIVVHGNLTLDGTLAVTPTAGGSFGAGVYRIFNYDGSLIDNGLALAAPSPDMYVQTSLANQVNLVNTQGLTLGFWDGPGTANDGAIKGGSGVWRLSDNDDWTEASGTLNAPYTPGAYAVFGGTAGTVDVDNRNGQVSASGLQFQSDGYRIGGDELAMTGGAFSIRVGDGSSNGAGVVATIDAALSGSGLLVKDDLGTLVLEGNNVYAGGTDVRAGTLQISRDANLGVAAGALSVQDATLRATATFASDRAVGLGGDATVETGLGTTLTLNGGLSGSGSLTKAGEGALVLGGASSYAGDTTVAQGVLQASSAGAFASGSAFAVASAAALDLGGFDQQMAALDNAGSVRFGPAAGTRLDVQGNYTGQGGTLLLNTVLGGDDSVTDRLQVRGDTAGDTVVRVNNVGGEGAQTALGIKLIDVQGASGGNFALQGDYAFQGEQAVVAGAYAYRLYRNGSGADAADGDWYLRSAVISDGGGPGPDPTPPLYQAGVPLYEAYAGHLQQINRAGSLLQRTGNRTGPGAASPADARSAGQGVWVRYEGSDLTLEPDRSTSGTSYDMSAWTSEMGVDTPLVESAAGTLVGSGLLRYGRYQSNVDSIYGRGRITTQAYSIGGALTWYGGQGFYVDGQLRWTKFDSDLESSTLGVALREGNTGQGYLASVEMGRRFAMGAGWSVVPQLQISHGAETFDSFTDTFGARVTQRSGHALTARAGTAFEYQQTFQGRRGEMGARFHAIANLYRSEDDGTTVRVSGTDLDARGDNLHGGVGVGGSLDWGQGRYQLYGEVEARSGLHNARDSRGVDGSLGFRLRW